MACDQLLANMTGAIMGSLLMCTPHTSTHKSTGSVGADLHWVVWCPLSPPSWHWQLETREQSSQPPPGPVRLVQPAPLSAPSRGPAGRGGCSWGTGPRGGGEEHRERHGHRAGGVGGP